MNEIALTSSAWPFQEARNLYNEKLKGKVPEKGYVLFETGYGPSGLPHIGTFGEVARTTMVMNAFKALYPDIPVKLFCVSDDMDGLRKVPDNIPNKELVGQFLGKPLTQIPDPFGCHDSFGHHNNDCLKAFLDKFGFTYEFKSATENYKNGVYDNALLQVLKNYEKIMDVMLPTLGEERRSTYSPFLPISPKTGNVLQVAMTKLDKENGTVSFIDEDGSEVTVPVTGGHVKLQWKADWAMRWFALGVDYEMSGKDLTDSVKLSGKICRILGGEPPMNLTYELFLDEKGEKISKSKGNGLSMEEWLKYAPAESLSLFMFQKPKTAKRLYFDVIPRATDEYLNFITAFAKQTGVDQYNNPVWHIHNANPPKPESGLSFGILLNLVSVAHTEDPKALWKYISGYAPEATPETCPMLSAMVPYVVAYYNDFVKPNQKYRAPVDVEITALTELRDWLKQQDKSISGEDIQTYVYEIGKKFYPEDLKAWFKVMYETLLGQSTGPRMGSFIALYGIDDSIELIDKALKNQL